MVDISFFDCNCSIGRRNIPPRFGNYTSPQELLKRMDYFGIDEALVYHSISEEYDPEMGNRLLLQELAGLERLHPCWVVIPHFTGEMTPPDKLIPDMLQSGVKAVMVFPGEPGDFSFNLRNYGPLIDALESHRMPLLIHSDHSTPFRAGEPHWDMVEKICATYPHLPLILTNCWHRIDRNIFPLWEKYDNLYVETCRYDVPDGLLNICRRFGPQRLLFGTGSPYIFPGCATSALVYSGLEQKEMALIAGGNLRKILRGVRDAG